MAFTLHRNRIDKVLRNEIVAELHRAKEHYGTRYFTGREFNKVSKIKRTTVIREYGSWQEALRSVGIENAPIRKARKDQIPERELFAELERVWLLRGHRPSRNEWEISSPQFSYTTYKTRFGGWTNAACDLSSINPDS